MTLSDLAAGMLAVANSSPIAFAAVVETAALVGACLRRPPGAPGAEKIFAFPTVRDWLTFTAEPSYQNTTALLVGVAAQPNAKPLAGFTRPPARTVRHACTCTRRSFSSGRFAAGNSPWRKPPPALFDVGRVLGVLHLLPDRRPGLGAGKSRFYRGACWFGPLDL